MPFDHSCLEESISDGGIVSWYQAGVDLAVILTSHHLLGYFRQCQVHASNPALQASFGYPDFSKNTLPAVMHREEVNPALTSFTRGSRVTLEALWS